MLDLKCLWEKKHYTYTYRIKKNWGMKMRIIQIDCPAANNGPKGVNVSSRENILYFWENKNSPALQYGIITKNCRNQGILVL